MSDKFQDKYRIPSARWQDWDYSWNGAYFITICTAGMDYDFGEIQLRDAINRVSTDSTIMLSEIGKIAGHFWYEIPKHFPFAKLGEFIVMPNHVHGIIVIDKMDNGCWNDEYSNRRDAIHRVSDQNAIMPGRDAIHRVSIENSTIPNRDAMNRVSTAKPGGITGNKNPMTSDNLSKIIRWYKGRVAFESHKIRAGFDWQPRFHDHIIRSDDAYQRISAYIQNNPKNWLADKFYMDS